MSETETVGPCLVQKLKWEGGRGYGPPGPSSGYTPANRVHFDVSNNFSFFEVFSSTWMIGGQKLMPMR